MSGKRVNRLYVIRCMIWYQMLKNGIRMVGQNAFLTSQNVFEWLSQESIFLNPFAWHSNSHLTFNHLLNMCMKPFHEILKPLKNCFI